MKLRDAIMDETGIDIAQASGTATRLPRAMRERGLDVDDTGRAGASSSTSSCRSASSRS